MTKREFSESQPKYATNNADAERMQDFVDELLTLTSAIIDAATVVNEALESKQENVLGFVHSYSGILEGIVDKAERISAIADKL